MDQCRPKGQVPNILKVQGERETLAGNSANKRPSRKAEDHPTDEIHCGQERVYKQQKQLQNIIYQADISMHMLNKLYWSD